MDSQDHPIPSTSRSAKNRERMAVGTVDFADKIVALQRRNAAATKPRDRSERHPTPTLSPSSKRRAASPTAHVLTTPQEQALSDPNPDDFQRRLRISPEQPRANTSNVTPKPRGRLLQLPEGTSSIRKTAEPEAYSEASSSAAISTPSGFLEIHHRSLRPAPLRGDQDNTASRQLFDYRKDDPVRFQSSMSSRPVPTSKSSADTFVSASSTSASSYAHSIGSSFTLTSNSTGTSDSSLSGINVPKEGSEGNNAFVFQLKRLYREITSLEGKLISEDVDLSADEEPRFTLHGSSGGLENVPEDKYLKVTNEHKRLADMMQKLMATTLSPQVPTSVHSISTKYNIPTRLWGNAFHRVLESLRRASASSPIALEHLNDMIYWAYSFYTALVEDPQVESFRGSWLEALGDLARYRMAIASFNPAADYFGPTTQLSVHELSTEDQGDDSSNPSVGAHAALALEVEPEGEQWRGTARRWYALGLQDTPGTGKLHHHLGLLSRDTTLEELRAVYHFAKSLTVTHPFLTSRETILSMFSLEAQKRRAMPDSKTRELFILLQGMLFTHIDLDNFQPTLARFLERLSLDASIGQEARLGEKQLEERDWIMIGILCIISLLEYGSPNGCLKGINGGVAGSSVTRLERDNDFDVKALVKRSKELRVADEPDMELDGHCDSRENPLDDASALSSTSSVPVAFHFGSQMSFDILKHVLRNPYRKSTPFARSSLNPYIVIHLTFLASSLRHPRSLELLERNLPWGDLVTFLNTAPRQIQTVELGTGSRLTQGTAPLPEDWCLRGMESFARRTFERGFWRVDSGLGSEQGVLNLEELGADATDGIIEDDDDEENDKAATRDRGETQKRWVRILRASLILSRAVEGLGWDADSHQWKITGDLARKMAVWKEEKAASLETEKSTSRHGITSEDDMQIDEVFSDADVSESDEDDSVDDSLEVKELKARRRHLRRLLVESDQQPSRQTGRQSHPKRAAHPPAQMPRLLITPGFTTLVVDTNILLSSLSEFVSLVESGYWTVVVPLAVITELDGLASNNNALGEIASKAVKAISSHLRSHSISLKVQTSKGNYLTTLGVRNENVLLGAESSWERNMDDVILRAAVWQFEHWVDRSDFLKRGSEVTSHNSGSKVVLLTFDRNLRLKAKARKVDVASNHEIASILVAGSSTG